MSSFENLVREVPTEHRKGLDDKKKPIAYEHEVDNSTDYMKQ